jgi:hypothetical protein
MQRHIALLTGEISERLDTIRYVEANLRILEVEEKLLSAVCASKAERILKGNLKK